MRSAIDSDLLAGLRSVYLFSELSDKHLRRVAELGKFVEHPTGHEIVSQGELALRFHLLLDGAAEVMVNNEARRVLGAGDYFGEVAVLDGKPRSASVRATTDVRTWSLSAGAFKDLLASEVSVTHSILLGLCSRLRELESLPSQP